MVRPLAMLLLVCACRGATTPSADASPPTAEVPSAAVDAALEPDLFAGGLGIAPDPITPQMRKCNADADCTIVVVLPCGFASVARTSAVEADRAIRAACPPNGGGGMGKTPNAVCVDSRCEWR